MTFCLGMNVRDGLVGLADTRVTSGSECMLLAASTALCRDGAAYRVGHRFMMTSGLRSVRDKSLTYFEEALDALDEPYDRLFKLMNLFAAQMRKVAVEDREALTESGLHFNLHALFGGQLRNDKHHRLYMLYPQGNWVEVGQATPYYIIGASGYGKPVLDRTLQYDDSMQFALKVGCLAFDSTRISAADVDFPIDVVLYQRDTYDVIEHRFNKDELRPITQWWQERLRQSLVDLPSGPLEVVFQKAATPPGPMTGVFPG